MERRSSAPSSPCTPWTSKRTAGTPPMSLGTSDTATDPHTQATPTGLGGHSGLRRTCGLRTLVMPRGNPPGWDEAVARPGLDGRPLTHAGPAGHVELARGRDQHTQATWAPGSQKQNCLAPPWTPRQVEGLLEPSWQDADPTLAFRSWGETPPFSRLVPTPSHLPSEPRSAGQASRGRAGVSTVEVCVGAALWLEAKAIPAGSGPVRSATGLAGTGVG